MFKVIPQNSLNQVCLQNIQSAARYVFSAKFVDGSQGKKLDFMSLCLVS